MRKLKSCGVIVFRATPVEAFLLLKHTHRYDLPKGHVEWGETELQCALRELYEEAGIRESDIELDPTFRYEETYYPRYRRFQGERVEKTLVVFLGRLIQERPVTIAEHRSYEWVDWHPPHQIQRATIDPLLHSVDNFRMRSLHSVGGE